MGVRELNGMMREEKIRKFIVAATERGANVPCESESDQDESQPEEEEEFSHSQVSRTGEQGRDDLT